MTGRLDRLDDARVCEDEARLPGNERLGTVCFPNGSVALLPAIAELQVAVAHESIREFRDLALSKAAA